jgi:hypothetical protein
MSLHSLKIFALAERGPIPAISVIGPGNTALFGKASCHCSLTPPNPISSVSIAMSDWLAARLHVHLSEKIT